jgi:carboxyl-terminal processing protease
VILLERDRDGSEREYRANGGGIATDIPVVILQNRFSASGAEVLAAALSDNGRATIVGETSFGKGTVNVSNELGDGGQLYVTIAKWLTPNGTQIDGVGVRPDVRIEFTDEDIDLQRDVQLQKAIDVVRGTNTVPERTPVDTPTADAGTLTPTTGG